MGLFLVVAWVLAGEGEEPAPGGAEAGEEKPRPASRSSSGFASAEEMARRSEERREVEEELARARARGDELGVLTLLLRGPIDLSRSGAGYREIAEALRARHYPVLALAFADGELHDLVDELQRPWLECRPAPGEAAWKRFTRRYLRELGRVMIEPDPRWQEGASRRLAIEGTYMFVHVADEVAKARAFVAGGCDARYRDMPEPVL